MAQMVVGARMCLERDLPMPALALIYTLIDAFAWAVNPSEKNTRTRFENWVTTFVYAHKPLPCTATELYAARCAVLHTLTSKADLHVSGKLRQVAYAWGPANLDTISRVAALGNISGQVVGLHINELLEGVAFAIHQTLEAANSDAALSANLEQTASLHYMQTPRSVLDAVSLKGEVRP